MSNEFEYEPVTNEAGEAVSEQDLHDGLHKPVAIRFDFNGFKGFTAWFVRAKVSMEALLRYQVAVAQSGSSRTEEEIQEGAEMSALMDSVEGLSEEEAQAQLGPEDAARLQAYYRKLGIMNAKQQPTLFPIKVEMLAPAIVEWNVPGEVPTADNLKKNGPLALAVIPAIWNHYQNFTTGSAAAAETTPTASTASSATTSPSAATKVTSRKGS